MQILLSGDTLERHEEGESEWDFLSMEQWQFLPEMKSPMVSLMRVMDRLVEHKGIEAEEEEDLGLAFLRDISKLAPVFMSVGNHEWYFTAEDERFFVDRNITVLDNADVQVTIKGKKLRIGGLSTRYDFDWLEEYAQKKERKFFCAIIQSIINTRLRTEKRTPSTWFYLGITMEGNGALVMLVCTCQGLD